MIHIAKRITTSDASRSLDEAELDGIAGGRMKLIGPGPIHVPSAPGIGGGQSLEAQPWSSHPTYLPL